MASADLLLHPVRLRIVQVFLGDRALTTAELRDELPDVPPATLYRHVGTLADGEVLEVVAERRVRGAVERTYRLRSGNTVVRGADAAAMSVEEHRRAFMTFVAALLGDYDRYLARQDVDLERDLVGYRQAAMYLTDDELRDLIGDLAAVFAPRLAHEPAEGRTRRLLSTILMPGE
ncbi:Helix-turn-helix domain-containing protein [Micromonospora pattaloongensis]|uniref:Helix-turn-helix domain-containing protein n=1 Tax=Micromonospora pattaloongensis TaxID=405436 RepID=A0A1H3G807_9ACTN|nr:helix-turn-helix domain-containing protein [Micromonospora pattaloongensis]SDX99416.1 Helix-turn-helix domain-containing protein [Micromonospora pattaloongensis]